MIKLTDFFLTILTTFLLVVTQVFLKIWLSKYTIKIFPLRELNISNIFKIEFIGAGLSFLIGGILWLSLLKRVEFNLLYPLISLSYIFGLFAAKFIFHEDVPSIRWFGVLVIMLGVYIISRN